MSDIVVTGRGVVSSIASDAETFLDALMDGASGIVDGTGPCADFDATTIMTSKEARRADRFTQMAVAAAAQAVAESTLDGAVEPERLGVVIGTGIGGFTTLIEGCQGFLTRGARAMSPHFIPMLMPNSAAGTVAMRLGAHGPGFSVSSACATGNHAIGEALRLIQRGEADVVVAGGAEATINEVAIAAFDAMGALSRCGISRPFDARRDGFVMGEGAGAVVLEDERHARARRARAYGRLLGYGASSDAYHIAQPDPEGRGAKQAMREALRDAGAAPDDVGYVNAHGTSTPFNDRIEALALHGVCNGDAPPISSTKGALGHLLGAAGAVEAIATLGALERGLLPPTVGLEEPDPEIDLDCVAGTARAVEGLELALSNSFGFGGQNACLAFARA